MASRAARTSLPRDILLAQHPLYLLGSRKPGVTTPLSPIIPMRSGLGPPSPSSQVSWGEVSGQGGPSVPPQALSRRQETCLSLYTRCSLNEWEAERLPTLAKKNNVTFPLQPWKVLRHLLLGCGRQRLNPHSWFKSYVLFFLFIPLSRRDSRTSLCLLPSAHPLQAALFPCSTLLMLYCE